MAILPLPLPPGAEARALLHHLLEHGDILAGTARPDQHPASDGRLGVEKLTTFDAKPAELEDGGDDEPDADDEEDGPPVVIELVPPKVISRGRSGFLISGQVRPAPQRIARKHAATE